MYEKSQRKIFYFFALAALFVPENHWKATTNHEKHKFCIKLFIAVASEVAAITHIGDRERIKTRLPLCLKMLRIAVCCVAGG